MMQLKAPWKNDVETAKADVALAVGDFESADKLLGQFTSNDTVTRQGGLLSGGRGAEPEAGRR